MDALRRPCFVSGRRSGDRGIDDIVRRSLFLVPQPGQDRIELLIWRMESKGLTRRSEC
jgi:hypothetical protein